MLCERRLFNGNVCVVVTHLKKSVFPVLMHQSEWLFRASAGGHAEVAVESGTQETRGLIIFKALIWGRLKQTWVACLGLLRTSLVVRVYPRLPCPRKPTWLS
jgi:hypothetical protein